MHLKWIIEITAVDRDGFLGRDNHPTADMVGETGEVLSLTTWTEDTTEEFDPTSTTQNHGDYQITMLRVFLRSRGVIVELLMHEIRTVTMEVE